MVFIFALCALKKNLADAHAETRANSSEGKSELITQLLSEAFEWKKINIARREIGHAVMALGFGPKIQKVSLNEMKSPSGAYIVLFIPA